MNIDRERLLQNIHTLGTLGINETGRSRLAASDEDKAGADAFLGAVAGEGYDTVRPHVTDDVNEFCAHPAFGLACDTTKVRFYKK